MSAPVTTIAPSAELRRARAGVAAVFLTNGALFANVVPRYPEIKDELDLSNAALGTAVAAFPLGALLAGLFAARIIGRHTSARVATLGILMLAATFALVPLAGAWIAFAAVFLVAGGLDAVVDVAQNAHALRVQRGYGRSINNSFHGLWSIGAVLGGLMGSVAAGLDVPLGVHLAVSGVIFAVVATAAKRWLLHGPDRDVVEVDGHAAAIAPTGGRRAAVLAITVLGVLAVCGAVVEDAGASWGALYLTDVVGTSAAAAGLAFASLQSAMTVGRLTGDRVVDRFGQVRVTRAGGIAVAGGVGLALAAPSLTTTMVGFAVAGLGVATLIPAAYHAADEIAGVPHGVGLTVVSWLLRGGFLLTPPVVGLIADATSLRVGLLVVVGGGVLTVLLAPAIRAARSPAP